jgi:replicative DNA helicase
MSADSNQLFTPPQDKTAEESVLGLILLNGKILDDIVDKLKIDFFYDPKHQLIFRICLDLWSSNKPVDTFLVLKELEKDKYKERMKDEEDLIDENFLVSLVAKSSLATSSEALAEIIKDKHLLRTIVEAADEMKSLAFNNNLKSEEILDEAQKKLYEISLATIDKSFVSISEVLGQTFERISELYNSKDEFRGIPTGFTEIDRILGGLHNSDLIILAARPSMGKTALALEIVKRVAMNKRIGSGVAMFSLEMGKDQLVDRMLSSVSGIDAWKIKTGKFDPRKEEEEFARLGAAIGRLDEAPIWIDESGSLNILELRSKARRLKSRHNIGLIVIDYLQLMSGTSNKYGTNRVQEVSEISRGLKMLAKELDVPVLALSQLSRGVEGRDDKRPMLSDLRESGSIEQDADVVMFVHRQAMYERDMEKRREIEHEAEVLVTKHRNGSVGQVKLAWMPNLATFENLEGAKVRRIMNG